MDGSKEITHLEARETLNVPKPFDAQIVDAALDAVTSGQKTFASILAEGFPAQEATQVALSMLDIEPNKFGTIAKDVFDGFQNLVFSFVASPESGPHLNLWQEQITRVTDHCMDLGWEENAGKFKSLAEMLDSKIVFDHDWHTHRYPWPVLQLLANRDDAVPFADIATSTKHPAHVLTRILGLLATGGLIARQYDKQGCVASASITEEGLHSLAKEAARDAKPTRTRAMSSHVRPPCAKRALNP